MPETRPLTVFNTSSGPNDISALCSSPVVIPSFIGSSICKSVPPVSIFLSNKNVVSPVERSPLIIAQCIGAAPLYFGNNDPCKLNVPKAGMDQTISGSILNATTINRSAFNERSSVTKSSSFRLVGCNTFKPFLTAHTFIALSRSFRPRPAGLSATVMTAGIV